VEARNPVETAVETYRWPSEGDGNIGVLIDQRKRDGWLLSAAERRGTTTKLVFHRPRPAGAGTRDRWRRSG
jgi:hypothetical protein